MKKFKFIATMLVVLMFSTIFLTACNDSGDKEASKGSEEDYVINMGYYNCDHMIAGPLGEMVGFFEEQGLNVEVTGNGQVPQAMTAGHMDVGYIGTTGLLRAFLLDAPIRIVANNHIGGSMYLIVSNDIKEPEDLIGKKLAIGSQPELNGTWISASQNLGIPLEAEHYETYDFGSDQEKFLALKLGQIDGFTACDPWGSMAEYEGIGYRMNTYYKLPTDKLGACCMLSMNKNFIEEQPELAKKKILAHIESLKYIYQQPLQSAKAFSHVFQVPLEVSLRTIYVKTVEDGRSLTWKVYPEYLENMVEFLMEYGLLEKEPNIEEVTHLELLEELKAERDDIDFDAFIKEFVDPIFPLGMDYEEWKEKAYEVDEGSRI
ncbi:MAG: ABC transporter substrate-binding protein [Clostridiaceae bacterium]|nr:ABC transporter substrate-binding protein [Clostridiaceae bacterium]